MQIEFDPAKNASNIAKHGVSLVMAEAFSWETALVIEDLRQPYKEARYIALGFIHERLHVLVFTIREGTCRVISLRKTNKRETKQYADTIR